jgi:cytochrome c553
VAEHEVKVDPMAKVVTGVGALVLLVAVIYLIVAFVGTINKNTTRGPVMTEPAVATAPAAAPAPAAATAAPAAGGAGDVAAGQALFATCAACHGAKGEGAGMFPKLTGLSADKAADLLKKYRAGETVGANTAMMAPNAKALTDANIADLGAFIASLGGSAAVAAPAAAAPAAAGKGDAALGKEKYATCAACHGANGEGAGMFPKLAGTPADKIADLLKKYRAGETVGANTAMMAPNAKALTDADIDNLAAYIGGMGGAAPAASATAPAAAAPAAVDQAVLARGRAIYTTCALCHGTEEAHTSRLLNAPMMPGHPASAVTALMAIYKSGKSVGPNSSFMWPVAQGLDAEDTAAVAAYIGTLKPVGAH